MKSRTIRLLQCSATLLLGAVHGTATASCGSAFCSVNPDGFAHTPWAESATQLDLRTEYIDQDQLRAGRDKTVPSGEVDEHDEIETRNRNYIAGISHAVSADLSLTLRLDAAQSSNDLAYGLIGGIKLRTGATDEHNNEGEEAERSLQPGTGSTDLIVGGFASGCFAQAGWYSQVRWQHAVSERKDYEPGEG